MIKNIAPKERQAFFLHLAYTITEGIVMGVLALNEFVFLKSLKGSNIQVSMVFQFSMLVLIFLLFMNEFIRRVENKKKMLRGVALLTRLPLILLFFFPINMEGIENVEVYHLLFLAILLIFYLGSPVIYPTINHFLKYNYSQSNFGHLFSIAHSAHKIFVMVSTFVFGWILDLNHSFYIYVYPVTAILGIVSVYALSGIKYPKAIPEIKKDFFQSVGESVKRQYDILKQNKPYFHFEMAFMLYGFAFMSTVAVITIYFDKVLEMNYSSVAFYKNIFNVVIIICLPIFGKILGKTDPRKFSVYSYSSFILFFVFTALTQYFPMYFDIWEIRIFHLLLLANVFYGLFGTTNTLMWHIGSAYFCEKEEAGDYQSVHLSLTGIRAVFAPAIGVFIYEWTNFTITFLVASFSLLLAILVNVLSYKKYPKVINTSD